MAALAIYLPTVIFISLIGGFLPLLRKLSQRALALLLSFSAGVLLGAVFFHMLPEIGRVLGDDIGWPVLAGFGNHFPNELLPVAEDLARPLSTRSVMSVAARSAAQAFASGAEPHGRSPGSHSTARCS